MAKCRGFKYAFAFTFLLALAISAKAETGFQNAVVSLTAHVEQFAEWADTAPVLAATDFTSDATGGKTLKQVGDFLTATKVMTLWANDTVTITAAGTLNGGVATEPTHSDTLHTFYNITGDVTSPDVTYKAATAAAGGFFNAGNTYTVTHTPGDGAYTINLGVKLTTDANRAHDAGDYTCSITLTATW